MNTPYLLVSVEKPIYDESKREYVSMPEWFRFVHGYKEAKLQFSEIEHPTENLWLIKLDSGLLRASQLICLCAQHGTKYRAFLLENAPQEADCKMA